MKKEKVVDREGKDSGSQRDTTFGSVSSPTKSFLQRIEKKKTKALMRRDADYFKDVVSLIDVRSVFLSCLKELDKADEEVVSAYLCKYVCKKNPKLKAYKEGILSELKLNKKRFFGGDDGKR